MMWSKRICRVVRSNRPVAAIRVYFEKYLCVFKCVDVFIHVPYQVGVVYRNCNQVFGN